jgi:hypothetical protein
MGVAVDSWQGAGLAFVGTLPHLVSACKIFSVQENTLCAERINFAAAAGEIFARIQDV